MVGFSALLCLGAAMVVLCQAMRQQPISVAAHVWLGYEPMFLAKSASWLDEKQVKLVETKSATDSINALRNKKVDAAALTLDETIRARDMGVPVTVVMVFDVSIGADMLIANSAIKHLSDLKGKRIGYEPSAVGELLLVFILKEAKLTKQDVVLMPFSIDAQVSAWRQHQVDAMITYDPTASMLQRAGGHKLFDTRQLPNTILDVLAVRQEVLDSHHKSAIQHLIAAHFKALNHIKHNPQDAAYRIAPHLNLEAQNVLMAYKGLSLPDLENNHRFIADEQPLLLESTKKISQILYGNRITQQQDQLTHLFDGQYLPSMLESAYE